MNMYVNKNGRLDIKGSNSVFQELREVKLYNEALIDICNRIIAMEEMIEVFMTFQRQLEEIIMS